REQLDAQRPRRTPDQHAFGAARRTRGVDVGAKARAQGVDRCIARADRRLGASSESGTWCRGLGLARGAAARSEDAEQHRRRQALDAESFQGAGPGPPLRSIATSNSVISVRSPAASAITTRRGPPLAGSSSISIDAITRPT